MCHRIIGFITAFVVTLCFVLGVVAEGELEEVEREYEELVYSVPEDVLKYLPPDIFDGFEGAKNSVEEMLDGRKFLAFIKELAKDGLRESLGSLLTVLSLLITAALLSTLKEAFKSDALSGAVSLASSGVIICILVSNAKLHIEMTERVINSTSGIIKGFAPFMGAILATGGSGGAAVATHGGVLMILGAVEAIVGECFYGIVGISMALSIGGIFGSRFRISAVSKAIRRCFGVFFGAVMSLLGFLISSKIGISAAADSMAMRGARIFASNAIPIVGGAVGDTLRTLASGLSYIKSIGGAVGIFLILFTVLPTIVTVWLYRGGLVLLSAMAEMLGADREREIISGVVSVYGYILAVIVIISVIFILMLTLFIKTGLAFGGGI